MAKVLLITSNADKSELPDADKLWLADQATEVARAVACEVAVTFLCEWQPLGTVFRIEGDTSIDRVALGNKLIVDRDATALRHHLLALARRASWAAAAAVTVNAVPLVYTDAVRALVAELAASLPPHCPYCQEPRVRADQYVCWLSDHGASEQQVCSAHVETARAHVQKAPSGKVTSHRTASVLVSAATLAKLEALVAPLVDIVHSRSR